MVVPCDIPLVGSKQIEQLVSSCRGHDITIFKHKILNRYEQFTGGPELTR